MSSNVSTLCVICETRRPRRHCPGLRAEICSLCCGTSREVTVDCPLHCTYLQEARRHERTPELDRQKLPNPDVKITEQFLESNAGLFNFLSGAVLRQALAVPGVVDSDLREALDALVRTFRTLQSGLVYETRPANLLAAGLQDRLREELNEFLKSSKESTGMETIRDADVLGMLVMLQRLAFTHDNGRPRGRAFIDYLHQGLGGPGGLDRPSGGSNLIVPA